MAIGEVHNVNVTLNGGGTLKLGTTNIFGFWAPTNAVGGCITVTRVDYSSNAAITAASAPVYTCISIGTSCAVNGTIATVLGSANWTAGTSRVGTLSTTVVDATYGIAFEWKQTAVNADNPIITASVQYVMGY